MGVVDTYVLGRTTKCFVKERTTGTFGLPTAYKPAATDALQIKTGRLSGRIARKPFTGARPNRDIVEFITGRKDVTAQLETWFFPPGGSILPDFGPLLKALLGAETIVGSTVEYTPTGTQTLADLNLSAHHDDVFAEQVTGWLIEEGTISIPGADEPMLRVQGPARDWKMTGTGTAQGTVDGTGTPVTTITLASGESRAFDVGSVISVGTSTNHEVTAVDHSTGVLTISPSITTNQGATPAVAAYAPTETFATGVSGSPLAAILGRFDLGSRTDVPMVDAEITVKNNLKLLNQVAFNQLLRDAIPNVREVSGRFGLWMRKQDIIELGRSRFFDVSAVNPLALKWIIGDPSSSTQKITIDIPRAEIVQPDAEVPEDFEGILPFTFLARASSRTANDSIKITVQ